VEGFEWRPAEGFQFLIVDKDDFSKQRWAQGPARAFYHTGAAWEEADGTIRIDAALYKEPVLGVGGGVPVAQGGGVLASAQPVGHEAHRRIHVAEERLTGQPEDGLRILADAPEHGEPFDFVERLTDDEDALLFEFV
jgi:hypothetical protein